MIIYLGSLESQTRETARAMQELGDITVKHSIFPDILRYVKELRREAMTPIVLDVRTRGDLSLARRGLF